MFHKGSVPGLLPSELLPHTAAVPSLDGLSPHAVAQRFVRCRSSHGNRRTRLLGLAPPLRCGTPEPTVSRSRSRCSPGIRSPEVSFRRTMDPASRILLPCAWPVTGQRPQNDPRFGVFLHPPARRPRRTGSSPSPDFSHLVSDPAASALRCPGLSFRLRRRVRRRPTLAVYGQPFACRPTRSRRRRESFGAGFGTTSSHQTDLRWERSTSNARHATRLRRPVKPPFRPGPAMR